MGLCGETRDSHRLTAVLVLVAAGCVTVSAFMTPMMAVDMGGEYMKIAVVKSGVGMEIALNAESDRKTRSIIAFRGHEREFASEAEATALKTPEKAVGYLTQIIGHRFEDREVQRYRERFPYYNLLRDQDRGTVLFKIDKDTIFSTEEMFAMILEKAKEYAKLFTLKEVTDAVLTVPAYYNQAERRAVHTAAELAGINALVVTNDNAAVALHYGVFRYKNFKARTQYYMFYDMGATSTVASIVGYNVQKITIDGLVRRIPRMKIIGVGFDRRLGGVDFTLRLRAQLADIFNRRNETAQKVEENNRAMAKLWKEAERVKIILSANSQHHAQVENLINQTDFRALVTRAEFEQLNQDLFDRVTQPIDEALKAANLAMSNITDVILMGGATRMPKVQDLLRKHLGRSELGKSINTDEAAALGAVYMAASFSVGFKIKPFIVQSANVYPISVVYQRQIVDASNSQPVTVRRLLFPRMCPFPQGKTMIFINQTTDFTFNLSYSDLDFLSASDRMSFKDPLISRYTLTGVKEALAKLVEKDKASGIQVHLLMNASGIVVVTGVDAVFGDLYLADEEDISPEPDTSDLSDDSYPEESLEVEGSDVDVQDVVASSESPASNGAGAPENTTESEEPQPTTEVNGNAQSPQKSTEVNSAHVDKSKAAQDVDPKKSQNVPRKVVSVTEFVAIQHENLDVKDMSMKQFKAAKIRLRHLGKSDAETKELEKARNELEACILDYQGKIKDESYILCSTKKERRLLQDMLNKTSRWFQQHSNDQTKEGFIDKLEKLKAASENITMRVRETKNRQSSLEVLDQILAATSGAVIDLRKPQLPEGAEDFLKEDIDGFEELIRQTKKWRNKKVKAQKKRKPHENPAFKSSEVKDKVQILVSRLSAIKSKIEYAASMNQAADSADLSGFVTSVDPRVNRKYVLVVFHNLAQIHNVSFGCQQFEINTQCV